MVLINKIKHRQKDGGHHKKKECTYSIICQDGTRFLQIDTYSSEEKRLIGKESQTIRFTPKGVDRLRQILDKYSTTTGCIC